jgi:peptidyl-tRNA hydrolase, PTH1 family
MKIVVGLGNPGKQYEKTRHNAGFLAIDNFLQTHEAISCQSKFNAEICEYHEGGEGGAAEKVFLVKPQSFMNVSGEVVREITAFYKIDPSKDLLVVHDEVDLPFGTVRQGFGSGSAGHKGVQNIIDELGTKDFARLRIGVESREAGSPIETDDFVLQKFGDEELEKLGAEIFPETDKLIVEFIKN